MRAERLIIMLLGGTLVWTLWKLYKGRLRKMWQRVEESMPRQWRPKSPEERPLCQVEVKVVAVRNQPEVPPYSAGKAPCGRKKTITTQGFGVPTKRARRWYS
jgi:hypothetical protein